jgi:hypothetical protein
MDRRECGDQRQIEGQETRPNRGPLTPQAIPYIERAPVIGRTRPVTRHECGANADEAPKMVREADVN